MMTAAQGYTNPLPAVIPEEGKITTKEKRNVKKGVEREVEGGRERETERQRRERERK